MRAIDVSDFAPLDPGALSDPGPAPQVTWIAIDDLRVDPAYQRPITKVGRTNIRRIAQEFSWGAFSPLVVSPVVGGGFAIVDGQHRASAAALRGFERVPCMVVLVDLAGQARAFSRINGGVTAMHALSIHRAAVAAGDAKAVAIARVCDAAGVVVVGYPKPVLRLEPHETLAVATIAAMISRHGEEVAVTVLRLILDRPSPKPGTLVSAIIEATALVVATFGVVALAEDRREAFARDFVAINLLREWDRAIAQARDAKLTVKSTLARMIAMRLRDKGWREV